MTLNLELTQINYQVDDNLLVLLLSFLHTCYFDTLQQLDTTFPFDKSSRALSVACLDETLNLLLYDAFCRPALEALMDDTYTGILSETSGIIYTALGTIR